ncbi:hypothetical protein M404DRAFT_108924, partial [Pisolithus tinctorius Marx 270]
SFTKLTAPLTKKQTGLLIQLRTSHIPLNKHLYCFKRSDTPMCLQCGGTIVTHQRYIHHFLFQCPRYNRERHVLRSELGREAMSLAYLLSNQRARTSLIKYISMTKHLQNTFGEV